MRRGRRIALVGLLLLLAAAQVAVSLRQAVQSAPPPLLLSPPESVSGGGESSSAKPGAGSSERPSTDGPSPPGTSSAASAEPTATPDPANILRVRIGDGGMSPLRMEAEAGRRLQIMITNQGHDNRVVELVGASTVLARSDDLLAGGQQTLFIEPACGMVRVRVVGTRFEAELRVR